MRTRDILPCLVLLCLHIWNEAEPSPEPTTSLPLPPPAVSILPEGLGSTGAASLYSPAVLETSGSTTLKEDGSDASWNDTSNLNLNETPATIPPMKPLPEDNDFNDTASLNASNETEANSTASPPPASSKASHEAAKSSHIEGGIVETFSAAGSTERGSMEQAKGLEADFKGRAEKTDLDLGQRHGVTGKALALFLGAAGVLICLLLLIYCFYSRTRRKEMFSHRRLYERGFDDPVLHLDTPMDHYDFFSFNDTEGRPAPASGPQNPVSQEASLPQPKLRTPQELIRLESLASWDRAKACI